MQIYFAMKEEKEKEKKRIFSVIYIPNLRVIFLYEYRPCIICEPWEMWVESQKTRV